MLCDQGLKLLPLPIAPWGERSLVIIPTFRGRLRSECGTSIKFTRIVSVAVAPIRAMAGDRFKVLRSRIDIMAREAVFAWRLLRGNIFTIIFGCHILRRLALLKLVHSVRCMCCVAMFARHGKHVRVRILGDIEATQYRYIRYWFSILSTIWSRVSVWIWPGLHWDQVAQTVHSKLRHDQNANAWLPKFCGGFGNDEPT